MPTYAFRVFQASWGIAIDVDARITFPACAPATAEEVDRRVFLRVSESIVLPAVDPDFVRSGLRRVASQLRKAAAGSIALIELDGLEYSLCDYQPEGLAAAVVGCMCEMLGCEPPEVDIGFDRDGNRYHFTYR